MVARAGCEKERAVGENLDRFVHRAEMDASACGIDILIMRNARCVRSQLPQGDVRRPREAAVRKVALDRCIKVQHLPIIQHGRRRCRHQFGNTGEPKAGVWLDRQFPIQIAISCRAGPNQLTVAGYGRCHAGHAVGFDLSGQYGIGDTALRVGGVF